MLRCGSDAGLATPMTRCSKSTNPGPNGLTEIMLEPKIDRHNLIAQIRAHFPELEESYQREHEKWEKGAGRDGWPTQARFWLEWGSSHITDLVE
jgi:hypothetical protein